MQKQRPTELKINLSEIQLQTFSHSFFFHTTKSGLSDESHMGMITVIDCCSLPFQGLTRKMCEGTGMLSWPPRPMINAVCTADLCPSAREHWERLWNTWSCASIKPEQEQPQSSSILLEAKEVWFRLLKHCKQSTPVLWQSIQLLPLLLPISGQDVAQRVPSIAKVDETGLADWHEP